MKVRPLLDVESDEDALFVRKVADDFLDRLGKAAHKRRYSEDLVPGGELWGLRQVDDFDAILPGEVRLADALEICESRDRFLGPQRSPPRDVSFQMSCRYFLFFRLADAA
jgi:hypothetical protein